MGSIYALVALGFVLIYKSTSILNLAQGEFMMVGAYICLSMTLDFGLNFFASFLITMVFSVILGLAVERLVLRPLIGEPIISIIMVTLGLTYILRGVVIMLWGNDIRQFNIFPTQPIDLWGVKITYLYLWSMGISVVLLSFFAVFFTSFTSSFASTFMSGEYSLSVSWTLILSGNMMSPGTMFTSIPITPCLSFA